jgi:hypothetical protein
VAVVVGEDVDDPRQPAERMSNMAPATAGHGQSG